MKKLKKDWVFHFGFDYYENAYEWEIVCENCGHDNRIWIKKGIKIPSFIKCENCSCQTTEIHKLIGKAIVGL